MNYGWIIDKDEIDGSGIGTMGPRSISEDFQKGLLQGSGRKFRMYDDDGELYYEGRILTQADDETLFAPLDDYGTPNAGCTEIRYLNGREWRTL